MSKADALREELAALRRRLAEAEAQGYQAVWVSVSPGTEPTAGQGLFAAAYLAERTASARVGLRSAPPVGLHPLRLAEDLAVLDIVTGGRLDWAPTDAASPECLDVILRAWRGEPFAHEGEQYAFPELTCLPPPVQRPHPGLWLGPDHARPSAAVAQQTGRLAQAGSVAASAGPEPDGSGLALVCPLLEAGDWATEVAQWRERLEPDWLLVWPEAGSGDEALAARTQSLFAERIDDLSA